MNILLNPIREFFSDIRAGWNSFWFNPQDPATLSFIRIAAGAMLFYTHLVWTIELDAFFGSASWLNAETISLMNQGGYQWSPWWIAESTGAVWMLHGITLLACASLTLGYQTRIASVLTWFLTLSYNHRVPTALYGLDQINGFLSMYLMFGDAGARYSIDSWLKKRNNAGSVFVSVVSPSGPKMLRVEMDSSLKAWRTGTR